MAALPTATRKTTSYESDKEVRHVKELGGVFRNKPQVTVVRTGQKWKPLHGWGEAEDNPELRARNGMKRQSIEPV